MNTTLNKIMSLADNKTLNELRIISPDGEKVYREVMISKINDIKQTNANLTVDILLQSKDTQPIGEFVIYEQLFDIVPVQSPTEVIKSIIATENFDLYNLLSSLPNIKWKELIEPTIKSGNFVLLSDIFTKDTSLQFTIVRNIVTKNIDTENAKIVILACVISDTFFDKLYNHPSITTSVEFVEKCVRYALKFKAFKTLKIIFDNIDTYPLPKHNRDDIVDEIFDGSIRNDNPQVVEYIMDKIGNKVLTKSDILLRAIDFSAIKVINWASDKNITPHVSKSTIHLIIKCGILNESAKSFISSNAEHLDIYSLIDIAIKYGNVAMIDYFIQYYPTNATPSNVLKIMMKTNISKLNDNKKVLYDILLYHMIKKYPDDAKALLPKMIASFTATNNLNGFMVLSNLKYDIDYMTVAIECSDNIDLLEWAYIHSSLSQSWNMSDFNDNFIKTEASNRWKQMKSALHAKIEELYTKL